MEKGRQGLLCFSERHLGQRDSELSSNTPGLHDPPLAHNYTRQCPFLWERLSCTVFSLSLRFLSSPLPAVENERSLAPTTK